MAEFNLGRLNAAKEKLGESPLVLPTTTYKEPIIVNDRLVDENDMHKVIGTKGDMYTKKVLHKILQEGCLDHDPRPKYYDDYEGATAKRTITYMTEEGPKELVLETKDIVKLLDNGFKVFKGKDDKVGTEYPDSIYSGSLITKDGEEVMLHPLDELEEHDNFVRVKVPAHTISVNEGCSVTYDLSKGESPMTTLRPQAIKAFIAEILWIYREESTDLVEFDELLGNNTWDEDHTIHNWWDEWALRDENGNYILNEKGHPYIGTTYGEILRRRRMLYTQVIDQIRKNPDGRRNICCMWQVDDFNEPHGLKPCAYETVWNVRHGWDGVDYLDMTLNQRSSDFCTASCINQAQYVALLIVVACELGLTPGYFTWNPVNVQIYDRHIEQAIEMLNREPLDISGRIMLREGTTFATMTPDDVYVEGLETKEEKALVRKKNPQLKFQLGI